jgi:hypothetical protein
VGAIVDCFLDRLDRNVIVGRYFLDGPRFRSNRCAIKSFRPDFAFLVEELPVIGSRPTIQVFVVTLKAQVMLLVVASGRPFIVIATCLEFNSSEGKAA